MIDREILQEIKKANLHPVNMIAKQLLRKVGERIEDNQLNMAQLMSWALENKKVQLPYLVGVSESEMRETLDGIIMSMNENPKIIMNQLILTDEPVIEASELTIKKKPHEAAEYLIDKIMSKLIEKGIIFNNPEELRYED